MPVRTFNTNIRNLAFCTLASLPLGSVASDVSRSVHTQIHENVLSTVENKLEDIFPSAQIHITLNEINPNLLLTECEGEPSVTLPDTLRERFSATVRCTDEGNVWKLYVRGSAEVLMPTLVLAEGLSRGDTIQPFHLSYSEINVLGENGQFFTDESEVVGTQVRRPLGAGMVLNERMISQPIVIERNELVEVEISRRNLTITLKAISMEEARKGERLRLRNEQTNKIITAIATDKGKAVAL